MGGPLSDPTRYRSWLEFSSIVLSPGRILLISCILSVCLFHSHNNTSSHSHISARHLDMIAPFPSTSSLELRIYSNADWVECSTTRRSTTCFYIFLMNSLISWREKQGMVSKSNWKVEYQAVLTATSEIWFCDFLADIGVQFFTLTSLYYDN